jgi:broad specificity phosphatase PhoE
MATLQRTVILIRHGQSEQVGDDPPLTALGREQAALTARALAEETVSAIYTSDLQRARHTADVLVEMAFPDLTPVVNAALREGTPTVPPLFAGYFAARADQLKYRPEGTAAVRARLDMMAVHLFRPAPGDVPTTEIVVMHGNAMRYLLCAVLGIDVNLWPQLYVHNASISRIVVAPDALSANSDSDRPLIGLGSFNETVHLPPEMRTLA